ncbi:hypothetical protein LCGC14_1161160 [marine sediment metagenome]|uniref:Helicase ATP-binding domain-containing protein n=1 Tax=marine sediment metagenome TaxID=412755 RepID=A0A0F9MFK4_9ZZZZ
MSRLYDYQVEGVQFMTSRTHSLNADDMGLGKTIQTIAAMGELGAKKVLIICPKSVKYYWARKIKEWSRYPHSIQVVEGMNAWINPDIDIVILNYHLLLSKTIVNQLNKRLFAVGVLDEAHYLQSITSQRSKNILGKNGIIKNCTYKMCLSGTPLTRPIDLYPILRTLANECLGKYTSYEDYAYRYCGAYRDKYSGTLIANGATNCEEFKELLKPFMIRRTDVGNLPDVVYDVVPVHIPDYIETAPHVATQRQETALWKIKYTADYIVDMINTVPKLVVFFYHREIGKQLLKLLYEKTNYGISFIDGSVSGKGRQEQIDNFINPNDNKVLLAQFQAAGVGVDGLQDVCNHALFFEASWLARDILQAVGRLRREGQKKGVHAQFLAVEDSIEYSVLNSMIRNRKLIAKILD